MIRVYVLDDNRLLCAGIRALCAGAQDISYVGDSPVHDRRLLSPFSSNYDIAKRDLRFLDQIETDVIFIDLFQHGRDAFPFLDYLRTRNIFCITWVPYNVPWLARTILSAGAKACIDRHFCPEDILDVIRSVSTGEVYAGPKGIGFILNGSVNGSFWKLSARKKEIILLIGHGLNAEKIAIKLGISRKTVDNQIQSIKHYLRLHTCGDLYVFSAALNKLGIFYQSLG